MGEQITLAGRKIEVKQLTMRQIKDVVAVLKKSQAGEEVHVVDALFDNDVPAIAVSEATGLSMAELEGEISQQEMHDLIEKVRAVNPFFVGMMERVIASGTRKSPSSTESVS